MDDYEDRPNMSYKDIYQALRKELKITKQELADAKEQLKYAKKLGKAGCDGLYKEIADLKADFQQALKDRADYKQELKAMDAYNKEVALALKDALKERDDLKKLVGEYFETGEHNLSVMSSPPVSAREYKEIKDFEDIQRRLLQAVTPANDSKEG